MENLGSLNEDDSRDSEQPDLARFITINNHQLRQPIYAMNLYLATLNTFDLPDTMRSSFENLKRCAGFLDEMFLSLLDLACLQTNAVEQKCEHFPIVSLLLHVKKEYAIEAQTKGLRLSIVPSSAWVGSNPSLVKKILGILMEDAIRFTDSGRLLIGCRRRGQNLRIAIYNSGNRLIQQRVGRQTVESENFWHDQFDRFENLNVGLALARELSRQLAAPLMFRPISERGSVIAFDLPLLQSRANDIERIEIMPSSVALAHKFVVVVDDDEEVLNAMRMLLARWQCSVMTANSGNEILEKLCSSAQPPDALICDYQLGQNESGLDVIRTLRAEFNQDTPALLITGETASKLVQEAREMGVQTLHKPLQAEKLHDALQRTLVALPA